MERAVNRFVRASVFRKNGWRIQLSRSKLAAERASTPAGFKIRTQVEECAHLQRAEVDVVVASW